MLALALGTLLSVGALAFVLYPLFADSPTATRPPSAPRMSAERDAVTALREIEFDHETGKLSPADYAALRARYTQQVLDAIRRDASPSSVDDLAESAISAYRARLKECPSCGPRHEPDALYCSSCGRRLAG
ncbi:MAG TPA: hypothetical protein VF929_10870 [Gemmatimonadaceae bacterium]